MFSDFKNICLTARKINLGFVVTEKDNTQEDNGYLKRILTEIHHLVKDFRGRTGLILATNAIPPDVCGEKASNADGDSHIERGYKEMRNEIKGR